MLSGYFTHALVDMPGKVITNDVLLVMALALGMHAIGKVYDDQRVLPRWTAGVLLVPFLLMVVFVRHNAGREAMLDAVISGMRGDWQAAAAAVDEARAADPLHPFYVGQRGYVYSILADPIDSTANPAARQQALQSYALSSQVEPPYIPHLLNRMYLLGQAGDTQAATQVLQQAIDLRHASYWALPYLLMGQHYEDVGKPNDAIESYTLAFKREPQAPDMVACQQRPLCRELAAGQTTDPTSPRAIYQQAQTLLDQGAAQQALDLLEQIPRSSADPLPWLYRTDMHIALGEYERAAYTLRVAQTLRVNKRYPGTDAHAALSEARLALAQDERQAAITALEQAARPQVTRDGYGYGIYRQVGVPGTLQPRLDLLQRTADDLAVYHMLAEVYQEQGQVEDATWAAQRAAVLAALLGQDSPK
jgi:tetratricopeptide (TPR) repeat protein